MLTIHINKDASGLVSYFTNSLSKDDYFFSGKSIPGRWHGSLKFDLGLPDQVTQKDFSRLAHNKHPKTGEKLTIRNISQRRTSIEYTFSAPKSVSLIMALSDEREGKEILNAHRLAVKKAMLAIEQDMQTQTRINNRKKYSTTGNIIYARFDHFTSRPVKEESHLAKYASDPNLHAHCVVMNVTKFGDRYQAIEGSTIHRVAGYYEALYHSYLSKCLQDLGYEIMRTPNRWEIKSPGMTRATIEKFSKRTIEIEKLAKKLGILDPKKKAALGAKMRVNKSKVKEDANLKKIWLSRLTARELKAIKSAKTFNTISSNPISLDRSLDLALEHHLERKSAVPTKKLLAKALSLSYGKFTVSPLIKKLDKRTNIFKAHKGYLEYLTTKQMVRAEDRMLSFSVNGKNTMPPIHSAYSIQRGFLNEQQQKAIQQILNSTDCVQVLSGAAGVGKSTMLVEIKEAAEQRGKKIMAFAPSSGASRDVLRAKGFKEADTIAFFLRNRDIQQKTKDQIILIDEASLVGVKTMNKIFSIAQRENARIILSGDARQHNSPEAGDAIRLLEEKADLKVASIDKILRQKSNPKLKEAIKDLSKGKTRKGYNKLDQQKAVIEIEDIDKRHKQIAKDYLQSIESKRSALVIAPTHLEGSRITEVIRSEMKTRGRIKSGKKVFTIYKNLSFTAAQKKDAALYERGMMVRFHQNVAGGIKAGQAFEVVKSKTKGLVMIKAQNRPEILVLPQKNIERFEVYQNEKLFVSSGDLIRITRNGRSREKSRLYNGQVYRISGFSKEGHIQLSNGKTLDKDFAHFTYGYVQTSHAVQGKDAHDVFVAQGAMSFPATNDKQFYVSASRARENLKIYTDNKEALREAISKSGDRISAGEIADRHKWQRKIIKRNRRNYADHIYQNTLTNERATKQAKNELLRDQPARYSKQDYS